jgi:hypothetical protein
MAIPGTDRAPADQLIGITGLNSSGVPTNFVSSDSSGNLNTTAVQSGTWTVQPGNTPNTTPWLVLNSDVTGTGTITSSSGSTSIVAASCNGSSAVTFNITGTWVATILLEGTTDGTNWFTVSGDVDATDTIESSFTVNGYITVGCGSYGQVRCRATSYTSGTVSIAWEAGQGVNLAEVYNTNASSLFATVNLRDGSGTTISSNNNQLQVRDVINTSGQNRAQSITTSSGEALGGSSILTNRKFITMTPTNGTVYWGFTTGVTTSSGTPILKNQTVTIAATDNVHIYLIAGSTVDCRIAEGS